MGHLINPTAMRIGWFINWADVYYIDNKYYPEFLHLILKVRLFLEYFLSSKSLDTFVIFLVILKFKILWFIIYTFICLRCVLESFRGDTINNILKNPALN